MNSLKCLLFGTVTLLIRGLPVIMVFQLCERERIALYNVQKISYCELRIQTDALSAKRLYRLLRQERFAVKFLHKHGSAALIDHLIHRAVLPAVVIGCLVLVFTATQFVWDVRFEGFSQIDSFEVMEMLENMGLRKGAYLPGLDFLAMEDAIESAFEQTLWTNIEVDGSRVTVRAEERSTAALQKDETGICDLVAKKDGYIENLFVYKGTAMVKKGQTVRKGETLVSADVWFGDAEMPAYQVAARGEAMAKVWYYGYAEASLKKTVLKDTGRSVSVRMMSLAGQSFPLDDAQIPFENYRVEIRNSHTFQENYPGSFTVYELCYLETTPEAIERSETVLREELSERAYNRALAQIQDPKSVVKIDTEIKKTGDNLCASVIIETLEDIAVAVFR